MAEIALAGTFLKFIGLFFFSFCWSCPQVDSNHPNPVAGTIVGWAVLEIQRTEWIWMYKVIYTGSHGIMKNSWHQETTNAMMTSSCDNSSILTCSRRSLSEKRNCYSWRWVSSEAPTLKRHRKVELLNLPLILQVAFCFFWIKHMTWVSDGSLSKRTFVG